MLNMATQRFIVCFIQFARISDMSAPPTLVCKICIILNNEFSIAIYATNGYMRAICLRVQYAGCSILFGNISYWVGCHYCFFTSTLAIYYQLGIFTCNRQMCSPIKFWVATRMSNCVVPIR